MSMLPPDPIYIFKGEMDSVSCIAFKITSCDERLYAGTIAGFVHVWDLKTKREMKAVKVSEESCISIYPSEDNIVVIHDKSGCISFWKECESTWQSLNHIQTDFFGFCKFFIFENNLYTSQKESRFQVISIKDQKPIKVLNLSKNLNLGEVMSFKIFELFTKKLILVAYEACKLILWDLENFNEVDKLDLENCPMCIDFDSQTCKGICGDPTDKMLVFSITKSLEFKEEKKVPLINPGVSCVRIRGDSRLVSVGCWDGKLRLYSWKSLALLAALDVHSSTVQDVCFTTKQTENGKTKFFLAAGSQDGKVSLWDLYNQ